MIQAVSLFVINLIEWIVYHDVSHPRFRWHKKKRAAVWNIRRQWCVFYVNEHNIKSHKHSIRISPQIRDATLM